MACFNPFSIYLPSSRSYASVPCGWCMGCRIDRRQYFQDKFEYSFHKDFNSVGSFSTITYDDNHLPLNKFGIPTLRKRSVVLFLKRLRRYIDYHKLSSPLVNPHFKYFAVGEYGATCRPHYHFIFCGLDYSTLPLLVSQVWKEGGIQDHGPILPGGIRYVLKYMDKQLHGPQLDKYLDNDLEPPFFLSSHRVGPGLYSPSNCVGNFYMWHNKKRPLPIWVRNKRFLFSESPVSSRVSDFSVSSSMSYDESELYLRSSYVNQVQSKVHFNNEPVSDVYLSELRSDNIKFKILNRVRRFER